MNYKRKKVTKKERVIIVIDYLISSLGKAKGRQQQQGEDLGLRKEGEHPLGQEPDYIAPLNLLLVFHITLHRTIALIIFAFVGLPLSKLKHLSGQKEAPLLVFLALAL